MSFVSINACEAWVKLIRLRLFLHSPRSQRILQI